jgi:3-methyladenine DNA glycosylase AlkD
MSILLEIQSILQTLVTMSPDKAAIFFKIGPGQYGEHDVFMGVTVPNLRKCAKDFMHITLQDLGLLMSSKINEERFLALIILTKKYEKATLQDQEQVYQFYQDHLNHVNNWNLVDTSAHLIIGEHLWDKDRSSLLDLAVSQNLWHRRIAIVSTWYFIRKNDLDWTFKIADILLHDPHDLIHKAVGWMLREAGKKNQESLIQFLEKNATKMPRTMLRYAIEKFSQEERRDYLMKGKQ